LKKDHHQAGTRLIRDVDAGTYLELFLVCAVTAILGVRLYLEATGFPQVGGAGLHIAHMLWGGLLMMITIVMLLAFLGKGLVHLAAIVGGLGFGIFIDELGKFITSDNNYFFHPTFAIIYIIFIIIFLAFRAIERRRTLTSEEALVNAIDLLKEAGSGALNAGQKAKALALLRQCDPRSPMVAAVTSMIEAASAVPDRAPSLPERVMLWGQRVYQRFVELRWFHTLLIALFGLLALGDLVTVAQVVASASDIRSGDFHLSFVEWADLISSTAFAVLVVVGVVALRRSRANAYRWFRRSMLVSIFFSQVFYFYSEQLIAVVGLAVNLLVIAALNLMIADEEGESSAVPPVESVATAAIRA
jgi:hypothetical protein